VLCQNVACKIAKQPHVENDDKVAAYVFETKSTANKAATLQTIEKTVLCQNVACKMAKQPRAENDDKVDAYVC
jgi:hypothetical protein